MATMLKNMRLTSVDLVARGANQEADICLFKGLDDNPYTDPHVADRYDFIEEFP